MSRRDTAWTRVRARFLKRSVWLLGLIVLACAVPSPRKGPDGSLEFPWGASRSELVARYGEGIHLLPRRAESGGAYDEFEIADYEFEGLLFVARFRVNREFDALGEVTLVRASAPDNPVYLRAEFDRLDGAFTRLFGVTNARYSSESSTPATVTRGVIWSKASPWILLRYEYVEGFMNSLIIQLRQSSLRDVARAASRH